MNNGTLEFLKLLHPQLLEGEQIELRAWSADKNAPTRFLSTDYDKLVEWVVERYQEQNVYVGVLPRTGGRGLNENIKRAYWLWADLDSEKLKKGGASLENYIHNRLALPPTMLVASHGDKGGLHAYWAIEPTEDLAKWQELNLKIAKHLGADSVQDPARVLRVVGTLNHKYKPPIPVKLFKLREVAYTFSEIEAALELPEKFTKIANTGKTDGYTSRSERDFAVVGAMIRAGYSDNLIRAVYTHFGVGDKFREEGDHYLKFTLEKMRSTEAPVGQNKWGIIEKDNCYYRITAEGQLSQLSTFVFIPEILLEGDTKRGEDDTLLGSMVAGSTVWQDVPLGKKAFSDNAGMAKALPKAQWQWLGKDTDVRRLLPYLLDRLEKQHGTTPVKVKTSVLGRHEDLFVLDGQIISQQGVVPTNEAPIVWLPNGKELPSIRYQPLHGEFLHEEIKRFTGVVFGINDYDTVLLSLGWLVSAFSKPKLDAQGIHLPVLNLFGTRGAGKTTLVTELLQRLAGYAQARTFDSNTTRFVMLSLLGSSNAVPISFSEFRSASMRDADQLPGYIRLSYDSGHDNRGRSDQTMVDYPLSAPFTVDGEDAISDPACLERTIQLNLHPETIKEGTSAYTNMQALHYVNLNAVGYELVRYTLSHNLDFDAAYKLMRDLYPGNMPDRIRRNFAVVLAGIWGLQGFFEQFGFTFDYGDVKELFKNALDNVVNLDTGRTSLPIDDMITDMVLQVQIETVPQFVYKYDPDTFTLWFNTRSVYGWWAAKVRKEGKNPLDLTSVKRQIKERISEGGGQNNGDYILEKKNINVDGRAHFMYGISLPMARMSGLDIPDHIQRFKPKIISVLAKAKEEKNDKP